MTRYYTHFIDRLQWRYDANIWFVFTEHPFSFSSSILFFLFVYEGPGDELLSCVRYHPVLPLAYDLQVSPIFSQEISR
uniref:Uncharacterized protein n=1 Tax=Arundo donax TaxID=35708 RepID=A0A0A8YAT5_ARUDO